ncbi:MAG: hypothetical protein WCC95_04360 [Candidatus Sulfotelmatobacter sp.]|jgi:hypothetical protein
MRSIARKTKEETAKTLAKIHFANEPNLKHVHLLEPINEDDPRDPIKLLEVVEGTLERGIEPIAFPADPARDIEYPVLIVEVSPREYLAIKKERQALGKRSWSMGRELLAN